MKRTAQILSKYCLRKGKFALKSIGIHLCTNRYDGQRVSRVKHTMKIKIGLTLKDIYSIFVGRQICCQQQLQLS